MGYMFRYLPYITEKVLLYLIMHLKIIVDLLNVNIFLGKNIFSKTMLLSRAALFHIFQISLISGFIVGSWMLRSASVCCNITCHVAWENPTVYSQKFKSEKGKERLGIIMRVVLTLRIPRVPHRAPHFENQCCRKCF